MDTAHSETLQLGLGYRVNQLRSLLVDAIEQELSPLGLTAAQWMVIVGLGDAPGRAASPAQFARKLSYDAGAMTRLLDRLEKKGFVARAPDSCDRRMVVLTLTERGQQIYPLVVAALQRVESRLSAGFSTDDVATFSRLLEQAMLNL
ncbi:MarR family transcriptional regulator [Paludibacterium yongneupense]|uniref:MarR family transcriptional regulator n=1 Tax=Paludibacterium yongneupense TaxID=400061 RepID=UPI00040AFB58|nr:MarR family transcriptional regulator [Paludibacterium yongneupense]